MPDAALKCIYHSANHRISQVLGFIFAMPRRGAESTRSPQFDQLDFGAARSDKGKGPLVPSLSQSASTITPTVSGSAVGPSTTASAIQTEAGHAYGGRDERTVTDGNMWGTAGSAVMSGTEFDEWHLHTPRQGAQGSKGVEVRLNVMPMRHIYAVVAFAAVFFSIGIVISIFMPPVLTHLTDIVGRDNRTAAALLEPWFVRVSLHKHRYHFFYMDFAPLHAQERVGICETLHFTSSLRACEFTDTNACRDRKTGLWGDLVAHSDHSREVSCPVNTAKCTNMTLLFDQNATAPEYLVSVTFTNTPNQLRFFTAVEFHLAFPNPHFVEFESMLGTSLFFIAVTSEIVFVVRMRSFYWQEWNFFQKWCLLLSTLLCMFLNPMYWFITGVAAMSVAFLTLLMQLLFFCALFLFWIVSMELILLPDDEWLSGSAANSSLDGISNGVEDWDEGMDNDRRTQRLVKHWWQRMSFYGPKLCLVSAVFVTGCVLLTWAGWENSRDPFNSSREDFAVYAIIFAILAALLVVMLFRLVSLQLKVARQLKRLPKRHRGFFALSFFMQVFNIAAIVVAAVSVSNPVGPYLVVVYVAQTVYISILTYLFSPVEVLAAIDSWSRTRRHGAPDAGLDMELKQGARLATAAATASTSSVPRGSAASDTGSTTNDKRAADDVTLFYRLTQMNQQGADITRDNVAGHGSYGR